MLCHCKRQPGELSVRPKKCCKRLQPEMATVLLPLLTTTLPGTTCRTNAQLTVPAPWQSRRPLPARTGAPDRCRKVGIGISQLLVPLGILSISEQKLHPKSGNPPKTKWILRHGVRPRVHRQRGNPGGQHGQLGCWRTGFEQKE